MNRGSVMAHECAPPDVDVCPYPHTDEQLRVIQELKQQHGIDYDSHGSDRVRER